MLVQFFFNFYPIYHLSFKEYIYFLILRKSNLSFFNGLCFLYSKNYLPKVKKIFLLCFLLEVL